MWTFRMFVYVLFTCSITKWGHMLQVHFVEILYLYFWTLIMLSNHFQYVSLLCHQQDKLHHFIQDCYDHPLQGAWPSYITSHHSTDFMFPHHACTNMQWHHVSIKGALSISPFELPCTWCGHHASINRALCSTSFETTEYTSWCIYKATWRL